MTMLSLISKRRTIRYHFPDQPLLSAKTWICYQTLYYFSQMASYTSASSYHGISNKQYSQPINSSSGSMGSYSQRVSAQAEGRKNPLLQEVDAELRKLKTQFDNMRNDPVLISRGIGTNQNPTTQSNSTYKLGGTSQSSQLSQSAQNLPKPTTATDKFPSYSSGIIQSESNYSSGFGNKVSQSFEIKRDVGQASTSNHKPMTAINQSSAPSYNTYNQSSYTSANTYTQPVKTTQVKHIEPLNRVNDPSYSSRAGETRFEPSKSMDQGRPALTQQKTEPLKYEIKRLDGSTDRFTGTVKQQQPKQVYSTTTNHVTQGNSTFNYSSAQQKRIEVNPAFKTKPITGRASELSDSARFNDSNVQKPVRLQQKLQSQPQQQQRQPVRIETSKYEPSKYDTNKYEPSKYDIHKTETPKYEPVKYQTTKTQPIKNQPIKYESSRYQPPKVTSITPSVARVEPSTFEVKSPDINRYEVKKPEPVRYEVTKPQPKRYEAPKQEPIRYEAKIEQKPVTPKLQIKPQYKPEPIRYETQKVQPKPEPKYQPATYGYQKSQQTPEPIKSPAPAQKSADITQSPLSTTAKYEPTKLPQTARYESKTQTIKHQPLITSSVPQLPKYDFQSPLSARNDSSSFESPSRRERDESIRKNQLKKYAQQEQKVLMLTKNIDTVNKQNASLKHQITKLASDLKAAEKYKEEMEEMRKVMNEKDELLRQLKTALEQKDIKIARLQEELQESNKNSQSQKNTSEATNQEGFNAALKTHLEENLRIKQRINARDQEIDRIREQMKQLKSQNDSYKNELQIQRVKFMVEVNNAKTNSDIELQRLTSQNEGLQKVVSSLDEKLKYMLKEDKKKDEFMMNYLKNKTNNPEDKDLIVNFFKQFEQVPKLTVSQLMKQERQVREQLKEEIKKLEHQIEIQRIIQRDIRKRYEGAKAY